MQEERAGGRRFKISKTDGSQGKTQRARSSNNALAISEKALGWIETMINERRTDHGRGKMLGRGRRGRGCLPTPKGGKKEVRGGQKPGGRLLNDLREGRERTGKREGE